MAKLGASGYTDIDMVGDAVCPQAPYYQSYEAAYLSWSPISLRAFDAIVRHVDSLQWLNSRMFRRMSAAAVLDTLDQIAPTTMVPVVDEQAADVSRDATVRQAIQEAKGQAALLNAAEARRRADYQQQFTSGGGGL